MGGRIMQSRREFLAVAGGALLAGSASASTAKPALKKAVKYGMIGEGKTPKEKLALIKSLGFDGVEMDSPSDLKVEEVAKAAKEVGVVIHGVVNSTHWQIRMSDPDPAMRGKAIENMKIALNDAKAYGAETVLLVPGAVRDQQHENYEQCFERSQACVRECIPLAEELKIKICIETVWNEFITKVEQMIEYVDAFKNPIVGAYFDVSNMIKYGMPPAEWIRRLGKRLYKFDFKGYSHKNGFKTPIGEGDENWPEVLKALDEVGYTGWATSEVSGGGRDKLADIARRMDKALGMASG
jgi:L-ribulose-5-phosphate 3-epimerase